MNPFATRSSVASSFTTGIVGWLGFIFIGPLIFGFRVPSEILFLLGFVSAVMQIIILRLAFFILQMQRHILVGAIWGLVTAMALYFVTEQFFYPALQEHRFYWLLIYGYIGAPVGAFLSYFHIDDKKLAAAEAETGKPHAHLDRDAHWLEPFGYGAVAYLVVMFPFQHLDLTINTFIVGAMSGVFAAGASHFSPDSWKKSFLILVAVILIVGGIQGFLFAQLFRSYADLFSMSHITLGIVACVVTYAVTFLRGRQLAAKEEKRKV